MFSTTETSVHVRDKNREISPLQREEGYGGKVRVGREREKGGEEKRERR